MCTSSLFYQRWAGWLLTLLLLLGLCLPAYPQKPDTAATHPPTTARLGLLTQGWRYHAGDNPAWARPDLDDSRWAPLDPTQARRRQPPGLAAGISWLRLRLKLSDSLRTRQLVLVGRRQLAAWELYLNGRLVQRNGVLATEPARVQASGREPALVEVPATGAADLVLAIRYAPGLLPLPGTANEELLLLQLTDRPHLQQQQATFAIEDLIFCVTSALFALLTLLHLAFFFYNPTRRANLYFSIYALLLALGSLGMYYQTWLPFGTLGSYLSFEALMDVGLTWLSGVWAARALYALFRWRPGRLYTLAWLGSGALVALSAVLMLTSASAFVYLVGSALITLEQLRLTGRAVYQRRRGSTIVALGFAVALLTVVGMVSIKAAGLSLPLVSWTLTYPLFVLSPALSISLFLAREFALDAELLQVKLGEVEQLSAQTLAQQQERQALLAAQNETLEAQVQQRTSELQHSLTELRTTQSQLIQKEKMASLGELTAGIAHEIQNPLNFVNNFAEVSGELVAELQEAQATGDAAEVAALTDDLSQNLGKISHHGRRAAAIVKGMLEHSRTSTGERAPTDVNQLADEYLRLAYQGLRAKDKTFNAKLETDLAPALPLVEVAGADLGRVLLNLFGNAFYAVQKRQQTGEMGYAPTVAVRTRRVGTQVEICVTDNGTGIPEAVRSKIFQPFFTTKPSGEGTGLGLSLSYDIITKGHGGTLAVASQLGQGSTFIITLPV